MLRVGEINYLNCTPIFSALRSNYTDTGYHFVTGQPSVLNLKLRSGEIDVCPSSSIEYARNPDLYLILPDLSISSQGSVKSVLLFTGQPLESLDGTSIALTGESATSVILLKILLACRYSFANSYYQADGSEHSDGHDALLLIGDRALQEASCSQYNHVYDLGDLWYEFTGLPFVFALWLLRKDAWQKFPEEAQLLYERLVWSKQASLKNLNMVAATSKQIDWANCEFLINYWSILSYDLTESHLKGLKLFYQLAADCGFIEQEPTLHTLQDSRML